MSARIYGKWSPHSERINWDRTFCPTKPNISDLGKKPPSLKLLCLESVAKHARVLSAETLDTLHPNVLIELWKAVVNLGRDSFESWLLFMAAIKSASNEILIEFQRSFPTYDCFVEDVEMPYIHAQLKGTLQCSIPASLRVCVTIDHDALLSSRLLIMLSGFNNLRYLDLRAAKWPLDINEVQHFVSMLVKNMRSGSFHTLRCVRFPKRGPRFLKTALAIIWPKTLIYIQSPVRPKDYTHAWTPVGADKLRLSSARPVSVHYRTLGHKSIHQESADYSTSCYTRNNEH